jgi:hypothetical protein
MTLFIAYYVLGVAVYLIYLEFSEKTQALFKAPLNTYKSQVSLALKIWTYPIIWPFDVGYDLYRYFVKKVPLEDL